VSVVTDGKQKIPCRLSAETLCSLHEVAVCIHFKKPGEAAVRIRFS